jgi:hypothetical protein
LRKMFWATVEFEEYGHTFHNVYVELYLLVSKYEHVYHRKLSHHSTFWNRKQWFLTIIWGSDSFEILHPRGNKPGYTVLQMTLGSSQVTSFSMWRSNNTVLCDSFEENSLNCLL